MKTTALALSSIVTLTVLADAPASAQQITGTPGAPGATTTIDGKQLPPPDPKFGGVIKEKASESDALVAAACRAAEGRAQRVADHDGRCRLRRAGHVRRRRSHSGARSHCRERTALYELSLHLAVLSDASGVDYGRNHHVAGFGVVGEAATGFPGYDLVIRKETGTIGTILRNNGYATSWFGKNHNTPFYQATQAGPFDQWPNGMGFEYFYGFVGGDTSQWQPNLFRNTTAVYPFQGDPSWNLTTAMADDAIQYMKELKEVAPQKPFLVYYVPGGTHAPHHPTPEWIKKISDMHLFDDGWNKLRETIFANQKRLGIMPENAKLTPWPKELPEWET